MKAFKLIFAFRFLAVMDVLFSSRFELTTYHVSKNGIVVTVNNSTKFDKREIKKNIK